jgi:4-diphosphocytidyl-2-C-methyl-D-erythritol kinase
MHATALAPAKVNLTLHVTGQRDDGYHLLDSLVVFADIGDQLTIDAAPDLRIQCSGPFSEGVPVDGSNLLMQAATMMGVTRLGISLEKHLPHAAGIGGGSSDAATMLKLLAELYELSLPDTADLLSLGADVPVCLAGPGPVRMQGIGEDITNVTLPDFALVLVNPKVPTPTATVFSGLASKANPPMTDMPPGMDLDQFIKWLSKQRNDLQGPASDAAPEITHALTHLRAMSAVRYAGMSGSGATCFAIVRNMGDARQVARAMQIAQSTWWVAPAKVMKSGTTPQTSPFHVTRATT